jgi:hypothetical protein
MIEALLKVVEKQKGRTRQEVLGTLRAWGFQYQVRAIEPNVINWRYDAYGLTGEIIL